MTHKARQDKRLQDGQWLGLCGRCVDGILILILFILPYPLSQEQ